MSISSTFHHGHLHHHQLGIPCIAENWYRHTLFTKATLLAESEPMMALQESLYIHVTHDPENGAILCYQAESCGGANYSKTDCSPEVVQRSRVLQKLIVASETGTCTTKLPIPHDVFSAWHDFDPQKHSYVFFLPSQKYSAQELCDVLQVCTVQCAALPLLVMFRACTSLHCSCCKAGPH